MVPVCQYMRETGTLTRLLTRLSGFQPSYTFAQNLQTSLFMLTRTMNRVLLTMDRVHVVNFNYNALGAWLRSIKEYTTTDMTICIANCQRQLNITNAFDCYSDIFDNVTYMDAWTSEKQ